jgi:transcriptional regulator with GAF, ATPase, and Fis domain
VVQQQGLTLLHKVAILLPMSEQKQHHDQGPSREEADRGKTPGGSGSRVARDLEETFRRLVINAATLIDAKAGSLVLLSPTSKRLVPLVIYAPEGLHPTQRDYAGIARWVSVRKAPAILDRAATDPSIPVPTPTGSLACVPLLAGQDALGALILSTPRPGAFNYQHLKLLEALADVAAMMVLLARQQEANARQTQLLTTVVEVGKALSNTNDISQILSLTTTGIRRLIVCEEAILYSYEAETAELRGVAGLGTQSARLAEQRISITDTQSVTAWVARQRRPLLHSSGSRTFVGRLTDTLLTRADLALLAVPLLAQENLWGVITLARPEPFDTNDLRTMLNLGGFVAPALAQAFRDE